MIQKRVRFPTVERGMLEGVLRIPEDKGDKCPCIIFLHSFRGNKDTELMTFLWDALSHAGFAVLRFDLTGHGESSGTAGQANISRQLKDIDSAIAFLKTFHNIDAEHFLLLGFSLGGDISMIYAADEERGEAVSAVATIGARATIQSLIDSFLTPHQYNELMDKGFHQFHDFDEIKKDFVKDMRKHDLGSALKHHTQPFLFMHASHDEVVSIDNARALYSAASQPKELVIIEDSTHSFLKPEDRQYLIETLLRFFRDSLRAAR